MTEVNGYTAPAAKITRWQANPSHPEAWIVPVVCPFCAEQLTHGVPRGSELPSLRAAHCAGGSGGYWLVGTEPL